MMEEEEGVKAFRLLLRNSSAAKDSEIEYLKTLVHDLQSIIDEKDEILVKIGKLASGQPKEISGNHTKNLMENNIEMDDESIGEENYGHMYDDDAIRNIEEKLTENELRDIKLKYEQFRSGNLTQLREKLPRILFRFLTAEQKDDFEICNCDEICDCDEIYSEYNRLYKLTEDLLNNDVILISNFSQEDLERILYWILLILHIRDKGELRVFPGGS